MPKRRILIIGLIFGFLIAPLTARAALSGQAALNLSGRILLQVQDQGQAWYVNPLDQKRYFLGSPDDAFAIMRKFGLGISDKDFNNLAFQMPGRLLGRILIKVEDGGRAYYVDPVSHRYYYLGRPYDAFQVIRLRGLGITDSDLNSIPIGTLAGTTPAAGSSSASSGNSSPVAPAGYQAVKFDWKYKNKSYSLTENLSIALFNAYQKLPRTLTYASDNPPANIRDSFYSLFTTPSSGDKTIANIAADLKKMAAAENFSADETVEFIMAWLQYIPYDTSKTISNNIPNYAYETIYKDKGVCSDKSFLGIAMLRQLGYGAIMFDYPDNNKHSAIGVECSDANSTYNSGYCYVETTAYFPIGVLPQSLDANNVAQTNNEISQVFSTQSLGNVENYQKTAGLSYGGLKNTISEVSVLSGLHDTIVSSGSDLTAAKTALDAAKAKVDSYVAQLTGYQQSGNVTAYNDLVPAYNSAVNDYNSQLADYQLKVNLYNSYVAQYNSGLTDFFQK